MTGHLIPQQESTEERLARQLDTRIGEPDPRTPEAPELEAPLEALTKLRHALAPAPLDAVPEVPGFAIRAELGRGGMGVVVRAHDVALEREVALKFLSREMAADAAARERFLREARALARLRHPNLVAVHAAGEVQGRPYFAMELVEGTSLEKSIARARSGEPGGLARDARERSRVVARIFQSIADALATVHRAGLLHRDVKPSNILIAADGTARLGDFGIAVDRRRGEDADGIGTLRYLAPERLAGAAADPRGDVYALGLSMLEALALRPMFAETDTRKIRGEVLNGVGELRARGLPGAAPRLEAIAARACARDAADRFADAAEMAEALRALGRPARGLRPALVAVGAVALVGLGVGAAFAFGAFDRGGVRPPPFGPGVNRPLGNERLPAMPGAGPELQRIHDLAGRGLFDDMDRVARGLEDELRGTPELLVVRAVAAQLRGDVDKARAALDELGPRQVAPPFPREVQWLRQELGLDGGPPPLGPPPYGPGPGGPGANGPRRPPR